jgi:hypothetical protein
MDLFVVQLRKEEIADSGWVAVCRQSHFLEWNTLANGLGDARYWRKQEDKQDKESLHCTVLRYFQVITLLKGWGSEM